jgi:hypothetical protein
LPERFLGTRLFHRGAETAERDVARLAFELRLELVELHDTVCEMGVLTAQWPARNGVHPTEVGCIQQDIEDVSPHEAACSGKQRHPGFLFCHEMLDCFAFRGSLARHRAARQRAGSMGGSTSACID